MSPSIPLKCCSLCKQGKPATPEYFHRQGKVGLRQPCKECRSKQDRSEINLRNRIRYANDPEFRAKIRAFENKPEAKERKRQYVNNLYRNNPEYRANRLAYANKPEVRARGKELHKAKLATDPKYKAKVNEQARNSYRKRRADPEKREQDKQRIQDYYSIPENRERRTKYRREYFRAKRAKERNTNGYRVKTRKSQRHPLQYVVKLARRSDDPADFNMQDWRYMMDYWNGCCAICERPMKDLFGTLTESIDHWIPVSKGGVTIPENILPLCHGLSGCNNSKAFHDPIEWLTEKLGKRKAKQKLKEIEAFFATVRR